MEALTGADIVLNGETLEQVVKFWYLDADIDVEGSIKADMNHRMRGKKDFVGFEGSLLRDGSVSGCRNEGIAVLMVFMTEAQVVNAK